MVELTRLRDLSGRPREATVEQIYNGLDATGGTAAFDAAVAKAKGSVRSYLGSRYADPAPINNPKLVKLAAAANIDLGAVFDAAGVPAAIPAT